MQNVSLQMSWGHPCCVEYTGKTNIKQVVIFVKLIQGIAGHRAVAYQHKR